MPPDAPQSPTKAGGNKLGLPWWYWLGRLPAVLLDLPVDWPKPPHAAVASPIPAQENEDDARA